MRVFSILDYYIGKTIFAAIMMTLLGLVLLSGIIKFIDQLKKTGHGSYDALGAGMYTFLSTPKDIQIFFPTATILGILLGLGMLSLRNELVIMLSSGYTSIQILLSVMKTAIPLALLTMVIGELIAPLGEQMAHNYRAQAMYGGSLLSTQQGGLWMKDGLNFIHIKHVKHNDELEDLTIYGFNKNRSLQSVRYAMKAKFDSKNKLWCLSLVSESNLQNPKQITSFQILSSTWKTNLTPDKLSVVVLDPDTLSISDLHNYAEYLKSSGQDASRYLFSMWSKILQPISVVIMILMALSFICSPLQSSMSVGMRVVTGMSFGLIIYVLDHIFGPISLIYGIPPVISVLLSRTSFFLITLLMVLKRC